VTCTGALNALVTFPMQAVIAYGPVTATASQSSVAPSAPPSTAPAGGSEDVGSYSHAGDAQFCSTHSCIGAFDSEPGYIVQCVDGTYSHSGGISGACSHHGGKQ
jgi:hypothetical protein